MTTTRPILAALFLTSAAFAGCASDEPAKPTYKPTLTWLMTNVFASSNPAVSCSVGTSCHGGANPSNGIDLSDPAKVISLKGKQSTHTADGRSDWLIIDPGKPQNSMMYRYLSGGILTAPAGFNQMPPGGKAQLLKAHQIAAIKEWILNGAKQD
jgi:hypothetical protein